MLIQNAVFKTERLFWGGLAKRRCWTLFIGMAALTSGGRIGAAGNEIGGDRAEAMHAALRNIVRAARKASADTNNDELKGTQRFFHEFATIWLVAENEPKMFIRELIRFKAECMSSGDEIGNALTTRLLQLVDVANKDKLEAVIPFLECEDVNEREVANRLLWWIENIDNECGSYSEYRVYLSEKNIRPDEIPRKLVERMFAHDPQQALLLFLDIYGGDDKDKRPIWWGDHVIKDNRWKQEHGFLARDEAEPETLKEVDMLSQRPEWWIRLYVAEAWRENAEFCSPAVVERLKADKHPLIHKAMTVKDRKI